MTLTKSIDEITVDDLNILVTDRELEKQTVDYKAMLRLEIPQNKMEFRKDISSFANASGGDYIIGIREEGGFPVEVCGMNEGNPDSFKLQIENVLQSSIQPRIPGVQVRPIALDDDRYVFIVRVPRSFARPHQVAINQDYQFWTRNAGGKYRMDVDQLRAAFLLSETLQERIRGFRQDRLGQIIAGELPVTMSAKPKFVLHLVPLSAFDPSSRYDLSLLERQQSNMLWPLDTGSFKHRFNFDGIVNFSEIQGVSDSFAQLYRNGIIEAISDSSLTFEQNGQKILNLAYYADELVKNLPKYFNFQRFLGIDAPLLVMISLLGVKGLTIPSNPYGFQSEGRPIDRNDLIVPAVLVEGINFTQTGVGGSLRPIFDTLWNACGWTSCPHYDDQGVWGIKNYSDYH